MAHKQHKDKGTPRETTDNQENPTPAGSHMTPLSQKPLPSCSHMAC